MKVTAELIDSQLTIALLAKNLGTDVAWASFLADIRRNPRPGKNPPDLHGLQLFPYAKDGSQPLYRHQDVAAFIKAVRAADPGRELLITRYQVDDTPGVPWSWKKAKRVGRRKPSPPPAP